MVLCGHETGLLHQRNMN